MKLGSRAPAGNGYVCVVPSRQHILPHAVFLARVGYEPASSPFARLGQAAFLVLRIVDLLSRSGDREIDAQAFAYQRSATERYCEDLVEFDLAETQLLTAVLAAAMLPGERRALLEPMVSYARYLEDEGRPDEALDVLQTCLEATRSVTATEHARAGLEAARLLLTTGRLEEAKAAYRTVGAAARRAGDRVAILASRLGVADVLAAGGDGEGAEHAYRGLVAAARKAAMRDWEARAEQAWGCFLLRTARVEEGAARVCRALELYQEDGLSERALLDLGDALLAAEEPLAALYAARAALRLARDDRLVHRGLGLALECTSRLGDRVGFARWWREAQRRIGGLPGALAPAVYVKAAVGHARFRNLRIARACIELAGDAAKAARDERLHEEIELARQALRSAAVPAAPVPTMAGRRRPGLDALVARIAQLGAEEPLTPAR